jgi:hypothetical protein
MCDGATDARCAKAAETIDSSAQRVLRPVGFDARCIAIIATPVAREMKAPTSARVNSAENVSVAVRFVAVRFRNAALQGQQTHGLAGTKARRLRCKAAWSFVVFRQLTRQRVDTKFHFRNGVQMPNRSPEEQQAKRQRLAVEGAQAMKEYVAGVEATYERTARLRAERLARDEAEAAEARAKPARKKR